jgi:hypothetical protein
MISVYDYREIETCFVMGSIDCKFNKFFDSIIKKLKNIDKYKIKEHPKEVERQNRLASQQDRPHVLRRSQKRVGLNKPQLNDCVLIVNGCNSFGRNSLKSYIDKLTPLNDVLKDNNTFILLVRGNDDPQYFNDESISLSNIQAIKDYSVVKLKYFNCLCIGGMISYDRKWKIEQSERLGKKLYWENERMVYDEEKLNEILDTFKIGAVMTPNCPSFISNSINHAKQISWSKCDDNLFNDLKNERFILDKIYMKLNECNSTPYFWSYSRHPMTPTNVMNDIVFYPIKNAGFVNVNSAIEGYLNVKFNKDEKKSKDGNTDSNKFKIEIPSLGCVREIELEEGRITNELQERITNEIQERIANELNTLRYVEPPQIVDAEGLAINQGNVLQTIDAPDERFWAMPREPLEFTYDMNTDTIINTATTLRQNVANE